MNTNSTPTLLDLASQVEGLRGPCRETDLAIMQAISGHPWRWAEESVFSPQTVITWDRYGKGAAGNPVVTLEEFTGSLDDAVTLIAEGVDIEMSRDAIKPGGKLWCVYLSAGDPVQTKFIPILARGDTGPLALIAASLRALAALEGGRG